MYNNKNIVCFGEILWDIYPDTKSLGGAPFNVAAHLSKLGTNGHLISCIGDDELGNEIKITALRNGVNLSALQIGSSFPTGKVYVTLDKKGVAEYKIIEPVAWDNIQADPENTELIRKSDALVFGSLACRSQINMESLRTFVKISNLNVCDLNIRQDYYSVELIEELLYYSNILKINSEEAELLCQFFGLNFSNFYQELSRLFDIQIIIKTKGGDGAEAYHDGHIYITSGIEVKVVDTVGSGDAFLAAFIHNYLSGTSIQQCLDKAGILGAYVATKRGAIPDNITTMQSLN